jgi:hypothetical protein
MLRIDKITNDAFQNMTITVNNMQVQLSLRYMPRTQTWLCDVSCANGIVRGVPILSSPNMLRQWRNTLGFGLSCIRFDGLDPYDINDFSNRVANIYILDAADVAQVESDFFV